MNLRLDTTREMVVLTDDLGADSRAIHKYALVSDERRVGPAWGTEGQQTDLSGVTVRHVQTVHIHAGHVARTCWEPVPEASRQLAERGATVLVDDTESRPEVIA